ncbi:CHAT domain-containing protein [Aspergillus terricola var. indicus]
MAELEEAIKARREAVSAIPEDHPGRAGRLSSLSILLGDRYSKTGEAADLEEAIQAAREAVNRTPKDHPDRALYLNTLGNGLGQRCLRTGEMADAEEAVQIRREAIKATPEDHPDRAGRLRNLSIQLGIRYSRTGEVTDLEEAIRTAREAVNATPEDHPHRDGCLGNLSIQLETRYSRMGEVADLEEAIQTAREAVNRTPEDHPDRYLRLNTLGNSLGQRYFRTGEMTDFQEAIQIIREAVKATPENHPRRPGQLNNLSVQLGIQYSRTGDVADLEEAIQTAREAVKKTPEFHLDRALYLDSLGNLLGKQYTRTGAMADLEESIQIGREAVKAMPEDYPDRAWRLNNLSISLGDRYSRTGEVADLEEAIQIGREALKAIPEDHFGRAGVLNDFGNQLGKQYSRTGVITDLEEAIQIGREAVKATPKGDPDQAISLNNLGSRLRDRYLKTGAMADLEEAILIGREVVKAAPKNHPDRTGWLSNLGSGLADRYSRTGAVADLDEAIQIGWDSVKATPEDHPGRAGCLNNLGNHLKKRYSRTGAMADLRKAIQLGKEAVKAVPENHPDQAIYLDNLANWLGERYSRTGVTGDLKRAIQLAREAVKATPEDHPDRARYLNNLGCQLVEVYLRPRGTEASLLKAIPYQESALQQNTALIRDRIIAGQNAFQNLAILANRQQAYWQQAYKAANTTVRLIPRLTLRSIENADKQHLLSGVVGFASKAAAAALNAHRGAWDALNLLELGRGVLAASLEEVRIEIQELQHAYPEMAERFVQLQAILDKPIQRNLSTDIYRETLWQVQARQRAEADKELDKLIIQIRKQPGFEDFLQAPSEEEMRLAAHDGAIITINVSQYRCDAIFVTKDKIWSLPLPKLESQKVEQKTKEGDLGSPKVLKWLWDTIAHPVLEALGFTQSPSDSNWPHVWWILTGPLSKFPLHAAGYHGGKSETVLDRVMSSYSTSVKAIVHGRRRPPKQSIPAQALLIAMEHTPRSPRLEFAGEEIEIIHDLCKSMGLDPIRPREYKQNVMSCLPQSKIFHFAGHGYTDSSDPSKSHLLLMDGKDDPFTVANLLEMNLRKHSPFLAYLSACGTGRIGDDRFVDESIHLISAFQLAGFRHVVGTLWEVNDEICVDIAKITYETMVSEHMTDEAVCRGLHHAIRELRDRSLYTPSNDRNGPNVAKDITAHMEKAETKARNADGNSRLPRDIVPNDNDMDVNIYATREMLWVPYVHYGV